jgi:hypothetical protein
LYFSQDSQWQYYFQQTADLKLLVEKYDDKPTQNMHAKFRTLMTEWGVRKHNVSQVTKAEI